MSVDPRYFVLTKDLKRGQQCRWWRKSDNTEGVGVIVLIWLGIEEMVEVDASGERLTLCPALGDRIVGR